MEIQAGVRSRTADNFTTGVLTRVAAVRYSARASPVCNEPRSVQVDERVPGRPVRTYLREEQPPTRGLTLPRAPSTVKPSCNDDKIEVARARCGVGYRCSPPVAAPRC